MDGQYSNIPVYGKRPEKNSSLRAEYEHNKKIILATQTVCGICGKPVDKSLKYPHPFSATVDHIIPVAMNGHPTSLDNLQLAHFKCNRLKSDKIFLEKKEPVEDNRALPQSVDWNSF